MKVMHVITGLGDGGAEASLYRLCEHDIDNTHHVVSLSTFGKHGPMLEGLGIDVAVLNMSPRRPSAIGFYRLVRLLRSKRPDVVQTWMYHGDLIGGLCARLAGIKAVVWGVRHSTLEPRKSKRTTVLIAKWLAKLSSWVPVKIVVCAQRGMEVHTSLGYEKSKMIYIPNGYDLRKLSPMPVGQAERKAHLASGKSASVLGMVSRFAPEKDHANLLEALAIVKKRGVTFYCLLVGAGVSQSNSELMGLIGKHGLSKSVDVLGQRTDIPQFMNGLDLHVLSSSSEGFPNVVAEAMACGTPCVVTDVGDAGEIVGDTGWVVPPKNSDALADAIEVALKEMNGEHWASRCDSARARIENHYSIGKMVMAYNAVWKEALDGSALGS
ncbi:glycosyltransferase family 4 protein [Spiribacter onubensis]|uniref:Glycosyltransferase n=1 Tax=Spiribacter onubensis TaxID=3122420 RepID=A0ABV3SBT2_9GAMM